MKKKVFLVLAGILILALACYLVSALMIGGEKDLSSALNGHIEKFFIDPEMIEWQKFSYMPEDSVGGYLKSFELDGEKTERLMACLSSVTVKNRFWRAKYRNSPPLQVFTPPKAAIAAPFR